MGRFRVDEVGRVDVPGDASGGGGRRPKPIQLKTFAAEIRRAVGE